MIQRKLSGKGSKIIFFIIVNLSILTFISCKSHFELSNYNQINKNTLFNDSLGIYIKFYGDVDLFNPEEKYVDPYLKKLNRFDEGEVLIYAQTYMAPFYNALIFYPDENLKITDTITTPLKIIKKDSLAPSILFHRKIKGKSLYAYYYVNNNSSTTIDILKADGKYTMNNIKSNVSPESDLSYWHIFNDYGHGKNVLLAKNKIINAPIKETDQSKWNKFQALITLLSRDPSYPTFQKMVHDYKAKSKKVWKNRVDSLLQTKEGVYPSMEASIEKISQKAQNTRAVMLNENHYFPEDRIMASKLLKPLYKNGYKYLAVEGVSIRADSILNKRKKPTWLTGIYTKEPFFALFLRRAKSLGYKIIGYDDMTGEREKNQARNIAAIFKKDSGAKIFVYAGFAHIREENPKRKWMAEYFKKYTGIDPLTIDQTKLLNTISSKVALFDYSLFKGKKYFDYNVDYLLLNNIAPSAKEFFDQPLISKTIKIPELMDFKGEEVFVIVYYSEEYQQYKSSSIPVYEKILSVNSNDGIQIELPKGHYFLEVRNKYDDKIARKYFILENID